MSRWAETYRALSAPQAADTIDTIDANVAERMPGRGSVNCVRCVTDRKDPAPWLLIQLWACGATVKPGHDGALTITPHASGKRVPAVLLAAARRHLAALAGWV